MITKIKRVGTLLPMTALVSKNAELGTFEAGLQFVDWLAKSKQAAWQILPLHQTQLETGSKTTHVPSPYKGYGIGLDPKFLSSKSLLPTAQEFDDFVKTNKYWVEGYALFCALRDHFGTDEWSSWPKEIRTKEQSSIREWQSKLRLEINSHLMAQARLHIAYHQLQSKARENHILLIGDMPFYLGLNSPLVWEYQHLFDIEPTGKLERVSGVLMGVKSHFGRQIWGHPLYRWQDKDLVPELYKLFQVRFRYLAGIFNLVRFDHAKGLFTYGVIDMKDHMNDRYETGPGRPFLEKIIKFARSKKLKIYAEDTGDQLMELRNCLHIHHLPGVKIFRFAYNEKRQVYSDQYLRISKYPKNTVAYTTTHDTEPLLAYLEKLTEDEIEGLKKKMRISNVVGIEMLARVIIEKIVKSPAKIVLIPLQDWLLTTDRINTPGSEKEVGDNNWGYRMSMNVEELPIMLF